MTQPAERRQDPFRVRQGPRLGNRLAKALVTAAGGALLVAGLIFDAFVYFSLRSAMVDDLTVQARIVAENSSAAILFDDARAASQTLAGLEASPAVLRAELRNREGRRMATHSVATETGVPKFAITLPCDVPGHRDRKSVL
jgi:hypothetical protein